MNAKSFCKEIKSKGLNNALCAFIESGSREDPPVYKINYGESVCWVPSFEDALSATKKHAEIQHDIVIKKLHDAVDASFEYSYEMTKLRHSPRENMSEYALMAAQNHVLLTETHQISLAAQAIEQVLEEIDSVRSSSKLEGMAERLNCDFSVMCIRISDLLRQEHLPTMNPPVPG